ncbi:MAG: long-chain fatty acid--CoA ligase [Acidobacteriota bacterium]|nr:long-chain fatty acid--CoA ligase [Acidobacteriota bacterium]
MKPQSIAHMFFEACEKYDKKDAVLVKTDGAYRPISHKFFKQRVCHFARGLISLGVEEGAHVAILAETRFEWAVADLGIVCAGCVVVPVYPTLTADEIAWILDNADAKGVVVSSLEQVEKVLAIKDKLPDLGFVILMDEDGPPEGVHGMTALEISGSRHDNESEMIRRWQSRKLDDLLTLIYTSGTTGNPKGVMLSHDNLISNVKSCEPYMPYGPEDVHLSHLPLSHVLERMGGYYCMIFRGVTIAYAEDIKKVPENIREVRPTILVSVPRLYEKIYAKVMGTAANSGFFKRRIFKWALGAGSKAVPYFNEGKELSGWLAKEWGLADKMVFSKIKENTGGRLRFMSSGGAPLAKEIAEMFLGMGIHLLEGYGLTETSPVLTTNRPGWNKPGTVGPAVDEVEIKIAEDGEILARGPNIMMGYYKNPEDTAAVLADGWFHTGDIGNLDADGFLRITDRKKDLLITSGGKNVAPQPLENALKLCGLIEQAVVIGDRRNFISALVAPPWETVEEWAAARGWPVDPLELCEHEPFLKALKAEIDEKMKDFANYERVKNFRVLPQLLSIETGELTPSMKVKRKVVNANYAEVIDGMYTD